MQLVKQVLWLSPGFKLYMTHAINRMDGRGRINTAHRECLSKKTTILVTKGLLERRSASFIKVSERMHSTVFKRKPAFGFIVIILT